MYLLHHIDVPCIKFHLLTNYQISVKFTTTINLNTGGFPSHYFLHHKTIHYPFSAKVILSTHNNEAFNHFHSWMSLAHMGCFTIRVHRQKLHISPVLTVKAYFDFKVLLPKHWSGLGLPTAIKRRLKSINFLKNMLIRNDFAENYRLIWVFSNFVQFNYMEQA